MKITYTKLGRVVLIFLASIDRSLSYQLYFRREGDVIILERFGHKNIQSKIINYLSSNLEGFIEPTSNKYFLSSC